MDDLYRDYILDHYKRPRNFGELDPHDLDAHDHNPLCGDEMGVHIRLREVDGLRLFGPPDPDRRGGVISFELEGMHPHDVAELCDRHGVCIRAGHHCAQPLMRDLGVGATARASLHVYNSREDVDRLVQALTGAREVFGL